MAATAITAWRFIAAGFGSGWAPKAPGTFGALVGLAIGSLLLAVGHLALLTGIILAIALGIYAIRQLPEAKIDPGWIVIDEIAGQMIPLLALRGFNLPGALLAFVLFRLFDIWKPWPVSWADRQKDEFGIMGDDIIAGLIALAVLLILQRVLPL
ncbi:MAG: phosphatidylglycerophosphatase A [Rhodospirillales bacterium]|nr:phosphatidylglycerophosphatase A [Rhodospirillales bacterium]MDE2319395.1 phosphatidylglycerophosphatase A [Rhodospirillales bacterium]